jgi:hypothetical protein
MELPIKNISYGGDVDTSIITFASANSSKHIQTSWALYLPVVLGQPMPFGNSFAFWQDNNFGFSDISAGRGLWLDPGVSNDTSLVAPAVQILDSSTVMGYRYQVQMGTRADARIRMWIIAVDPADLRIAQLPYIRMRNSDGTEKIVGYGPRAPVSCTGVRCR